MFRFHLVKDRPFRLFSAGTAIGSDGGTVVLRTADDLEVRIESEDKMECKELSELKEQMEGYRKSELQWSLRPRFDVDLTSSLGEKPRDTISIVGAYHGGIDIFTRLEELLRGRGLMLKMAVEIKDFGRRQGDKINVRSSEEIVGELLCGGAVQFRSDHLQYPGVFDRRSLDRDQTSKLPWNGIITVSCGAYRPNDCLPKAVLSFPGSGPMSTRILQKMLDEGLFSDATIISAEGEEIKCHKFILTGQSDVFEAMFKETSKSSESVTGTIQMDDMCSKSVKALLAYLYSEDIEKAEGDSGVALDLFQAAHKYDIPILEGKMKHLLSSQPIEWFNVDVAMRLYFFVKNLKHSEELKNKALFTMKKNYSALAELPAYIRLFDEEPRAARQLCDDFVAL